MDELEVCFCDLCNTSVPIQDLESGAAQRIGDKVLGGCCISRLEGRSPTGSDGVARRVDGQPSSGVFAGIFVMLVALAGAVVFLDWRIAEDADRVRKGVSSTTNERLERLDAQILRLRDRVDTTLAQGALDPLQSQVRALGEKTAGSEDRVVESVRANANRLRELGSQLASLDSGQRDHLVRIAELHGEMRRIATRIDEIAVAATRNPPTVRSPLSGGDGFRVEPKPVESSIPTDSRPSNDVLPANLLGFVQQLDDNDDGARFEAVDELLQSGDARVYPHILPLAQDRDPFVRRLVCEGLQNYRDPASVDALIDCLSDPESLVRYTAHASLKALTKQNLAFDAEASTSKRTTMVRRWTDWWKKARASF